MGNFRLWPLVILSCCFSRYKFHSTVILVKILYRPSLLQLSPLIPLYLRVGIILTFRRRSAMQLTQLQRTANQREAGQSSWVEMSCVAIDTSPTQPNSTQLDVQLSCVAINGPLLAYRIWTAPCTCSTDFCHFIYWRRKPLPESRYQFLARLTCSFVGLPIILVSVFGLRIGQCSISCRFMLPVFSQRSIYIDGWLFTDDRRHAHGIYYMPWAWRLSSVTFRYCLKTIPHIIILSSRHESDIPSLPGRQVSSS